GGLRRFKLDIPGIARDDIGRQPVAGHMESGLHLMVMGGEIVEIKFQPDVPHARAEIKSKILLIESGVELVIVVNRRQIEKQAIVKQVIPPQGGRTIAIGNPEGQIAIALLKIEDVPAHISAQVEAVLM